MPAILWGSSCSANLRIPRIGPRSTSFRSPFLLLVGLVMLVCLIVVCRLYFFRAPLIGVSISFVFYVVSIALSRALKHSTMV
jgi:hypothetical protein